MKDIRSLAGMTAAPGPAFPSPQGGRVAFTGVCRGAKKNRASQRGVGRVVPERYFTAL
ncbi:hypothetical protein [Pantoea sp. App145]|uniref:hypothetical protein n=1 Tax=Pantoea sp. App145 TaxID=3071567 RepID=UPI003A812F2D